MAKPSKLKLELNLEEMFGVKVQDADLREAIAGAVIDRIRERTQVENKDRHNEKFEKYSDAYKESAAFKAFGKTGAVNMTLSGDMLSSLDVIEQNPMMITLGFDDETQNAKAFNHTTGDTVPKRDFFGIQKKELAKIVNEFEDQVLSAAEERQVRSRDLFGGDRTNEVIGRLLDDQEDG